MRQQLSLNITEYIAYNISNNYVGDTPGQAAYMSQYATL